MSFVEFRSKQTNSNFKKTEFVTFSQGEHFIRILTPKENAFTVDTHFTHMMTIKCLHEECPICQNNMKLKLENPKNNNIDGYIPQRQLAYVNVLDRTPAKICPNCGAETKKFNGTFPPACPKCNAMLTTVKSAPLNRVKVLSKGKEFFDMVNFYDSTIVDEDTETPLGINNFDLAVLVTAPKAKPVVSARADRNDPVEVKEDELFDLTKAIVVLNPEEIRLFLSGTNLRDLFAARREMKVQAASSEVTEALNGMFEA